jgi:hypothetical protein
LCIIIFTFYKYIRKTRDCKMNVKRHSPNLVLTCFHELYLTNLIRLVSTGSNDSWSRQQGEGIHHCCTSKHYSLLFMSSFLCYLMTDEI